MGKKAMRRVKRRGLAWVLTLALIMTGAAVPERSQKVKAAAEYSLSAADGFQASSVTIAKNQYGEDYIGDVEFLVPEQAASKSLLSSNGITAMEVTLTVGSFTGGTGIPSVMLFAQPGEDGSWKWNQSDGVHLENGKQITLTYSFSGMSWGGGNTLAKLGIRFANCADGSTVSFTIDSAKLKADGSTSGTEGSGGTAAPGDTGEPLEGIDAALVKRSGDADWAEYNYTVSNQTGEAVEGIQIQIPYSGTVNGLQSWNCSVKKSEGFLVISHTAVLGAGDTYTCNSDTKFGFAGGAFLGTPVVVRGTGGGTSSSGLRYELTGQTKDVEFADTPVGKHGKLSLQPVDGYQAPVIVDRDGKPYQLRGASTHGIHWNEMHPYVNKAAFQSLRDEWGVNMVRLASYITQGGYTEGSQSLLDTKIQEGVAAATELGMYVIIDWHVHAENPHTKKDWAENFFQKYATMYKDYDNVIFEICNEPTGVEWYNGSGGDLYSYCKDIAAIIRNCGSNALIVCGTNTWSQDVDDVAKKPLKEDGFENILYTFHFYSGSHYEDKMNKVRTATAAGTPIFVTEFGICDASGNSNFDTANADAWIALCDENNISYACWSLCNKNESASYLSPSCSKTTGGWVESDLATTGIWLVNTYRAHQDIEDGTQTSVGGGTGSPGSTGGNGTSGGNSSGGGEGNTGGNSSGGGEGNAGGNSSGGGEGNTGGNSSGGGNGTSGGNSSGGGEGNTGGNASTGGENGTGGNTSPGGNANPNATNQPGQTAAPASSSSPDDLGTGQPGGSGNGEPSSGEETDSVKLSKVSIKKVTAGKKKLTVRWKKAANADGYQVSVSKKKSVAKSKRISVKSGKKTTLTVKKLQSKKKYFIRVRAWKKGNGKKVYGAWSKMKVKKTK